MKESKRSRVGLILYLVAAVLLVGIVWYISLPPLSIYSGEFWTFFFFVDFVVFISYYVVGMIRGRYVADSERTPAGAVNFKGFHSRDGKKSRFTKIQIRATIVLAILLVIAALVGSKIFRASTYSSLITVEEKIFADDIEESVYVSDIALMDTASARIIGARTLGTLSDLVSQYNVSYDYTQIAMRDATGDAHPYKVAPLEYASFFKWLSNKQGIPGYVKVDPVEFDAEFIRLQDDYIRYSPSAYFGKNLERALRFAYPTAIFGNVCFEVDDEGHPYWIAPVMKPNAGLFGAKDVSSVVVLDACTGETAEYLPEESPDWIDIVYYGTLVCEKYDWYGMLKNGYLNSAFSQTDCVVTTDDFGYKIIGNDVYIFTGVTSTSNDQANIGFILANSRTGSYTYYAVPGAEEYSAMSAAEGSVQQFGYRASFPSLVNIGGEATYIMVLKDASGIVKMYSMVNVRNYNIVVTSDTQEEVIRLYKEALAQSGAHQTDLKAEEEIVTVDEIRYIVKNGATVVYLKTDGGIFSLPFDESLLFLEEGDQVTVTYTSKQQDAVTPAIRVTRGS